MAADLWIALAGVAAALGVGAVIDLRARRRRQSARRRAGLAEATPAAPLHGVKPFATTLEERRGLALAAIYPELNFDLLKNTPESDGKADAAQARSAAVDVPDDGALVSRFALERFALLGPGKISANEIAAERASLERYWGIVDSASCMRTILDLLDGGARGQFDFWCSVLSRHGRLDGTQEEIAALAESLAPEFPGIKKAEDSLSLRERLQLARDSWRPLHPGGSAAWDYARLANIVISGCALGYLDNGQAWAIIFHLEQKAMREFRSWEQFGESILTGRHLHFGVRRGDYQEVVTRLLTHPKSPWRTNSWDYRGPEALPS